MPKLNGIQTIKLLRGINCNKIIIGITGSNNYNLSEFNNCGCDYIFSKPLDKIKINIIFSFINKNDLFRYPNKKMEIINSQLEWI